jgi:hypothetical protein
MARPLQDELDAGVPIEPDQEATPGAGAFNGVPDVHQFRYEGLFLRWGLHQD